MDANFFEMVHPFPPSLPCLCSNFHSVERTPATPSQNLCYSSSPSPAAPTSLNSLFSPQSPSVSFLSCHLRYIMIIISSSLASLPPVLPTLICSAHQYQINLPKVPRSDVALLIQGPSVGFDISRITSKLICLVSKALCNLALCILLLFPFSLLFSH